MLYVCALAARCELVDGMNDETIIPDSNINLEPNPSLNPSDIRPNEVGWKTTGPNNRVATIITEDLSPGGAIKLITPENVKEYIIELTKPTQVIYMLILSKNIMSCFMLRLP